MPDFIGTEEEEDPESEGGHNLCGLVDRAQPGAQHQKTQLPTLVLSLTSQGLWSPLNLSGACSHIQEMEMMKRGSPGATECILKLGHPPPRPTRSSSITARPALRWQRHFQCPPQTLRVLRPSQRPGRALPPPVSSLHEIPPPPLVPSFRFPSCLAAPPLAGLDLPSASLGLILLVFPSRLAPHTTLKVSSWMVLWLSSWKKPQKLISLSLATKAFFYLSTSK